MKHSKSVLLWLFVILLFFAVTLGGCGGGSSSSSKSIAPNEDVANNPNGENNDYGGGDDNYGGGNDDFNYFYNLNGAEWTVNYLDVSPSFGNDNNFLNENYKGLKVKFYVPFKKQPLFALMDSSGKTSSDPYILQLWDETTGRILMSIPFIRPGILVEQNNKYFTIEYGGNESQMIYFENANTVTFSNNFYVNGTLYVAVMTLVRSRSAGNGDDDYGSSYKNYLPLSSVNGKTFRIVKCEASGVPSNSEIRQREPLTLKANSYTDNSGVKLGATSDSLFWIDRATNEEHHDKPFTADFLDSKLDSQDKTVTLPIIIPATGLTTPMGVDIHWKNYKDENGRNVNLNIIIEGSSSDVKSVRILVDVMGRMGEGYQYTSETILEPVTRTSDEDYGGNNDWDIVTKFTELNNTSWKISYASVTQGSGYEITDLNLVNNSYSATNLRLVTQGDILFWVDSAGTYHYDPLTVKCVNTQGQTITAPLVQSASGFKESRSVYDYEASLGNSEYEYLEVIGMTPPTQVSIANRFYVNGVPYTAHVTLKPAK